MWMANAQTFGFFFQTKKDKHDIRQDVSSHYYFNNISTFNKTTGKCIFTHAIAFSIEIEANLT